MEIDKEADQAGLRNLVLSRQTGEWVEVRDRQTKELLMLITVIEIDASGRRTRLSFRAPPEELILRGELSG